MDNSFNRRRISWDQYLGESAVPYGGAVNEGIFTPSQEINSRVVLTMSPEFIAKMEVECLVYPCGQVDSLLEEGMASVGGLKFRTQLDLITKPRVFETQDITILPGDGIASAKNIMYIYPPPNQSLHSVNELYNSVFRTAGQRRFKTMVIPNLKSRDPAKKREIALIILRSCRKNLEKLDTISSLTILVSSPEEYNMYTGMMMVYFPNGRYMRRY